jgi:hypothetical protein
MLQAPSGYSSGEPGAKNVLASWVIAIFLLSAGGLFIGIYDRGVAESLRLHPALSQAPGSALDDALVR